MGPLKYLPTGAADVTHTWVRSAARAFDCSLIASSGMRTRQERFAHSARRRRQGAGSMPMDEDSVPWHETGNLQAATEVGTGGTLLVLRRYAEHTLVHIEALDDVGIGAVLQQHLESDSGNGKGPVG